MVTNEIFKLIKAKQIEENTAIINQDGNNIMVTISISNYFCEIKIETDIDDNKIKKDSIDILNKEHSYLKFDVNNRKLSAKTNLWIDRKPTKTSLSNLVKTVISDAMCTKVMLEKQYG